MLFQPGWTVPTWHFQLDVELLECLFQLLLVSSVVRSYGIVEQDELVMQHLYLFGEREKQNKEMMSWKQIYRCRHLEQNKPFPTLFSSRNFSLTETSFRILSYFSRWIWNCCWDCSILGMVVASRGPRFSSSKSVRYASYSTLEVCHYLNRIRICCMRVSLHIIMSAWQKIPVHITSNVTFKVLKLACRSFRQ